MKKIEAFIKQHRLDDLTEALHRVEGLKGMTVIDAKGFGRGRPDGLSDFKPITKIEIFCNGEMAEKIVSTISEKAHTGLRSDGKIYVTQIDQACRISTGECGDHAV